MNAPTQVQSPMNLPPPLAVAKDMRARWSDIDCDYDTAAQSSRDGSRKRWATARRANNGPSHLGHQGQTTGNSHWRRLLVTSQRDLCEPMRIHSFPIDWVHLLNSFGIGSRRRCS